MRLLWSKLIVALDRPDFKIIKESVGQLDKVKKFKVGPIAFTAFGPKVISFLVNQNKDVFLDLKFYDIPNTVSKAAIEVAKLGVWGFTVHLAMGRSSLKTVRSTLDEFCAVSNLKQPLIIGVTQLTSTKTSVNRVLRMAEAGFISGMDGVVASPHEAKYIKDLYPSLLVITPGIRISKIDDQHRISTASYAFSQKADYIVVGRPIINSNNLAEAARNILKS